MSTERKGETSEKDWHISKTVEAGMDKRTEKAREGGGVGKIQQEA